MKTDNGKSPKNILKTVCQPFFDKKFIERPKLGFALPMRDWFRRTESWGRFLNILRDEQFLSRGLYDHAYVNTLVAEHLDRKQDNARILWLVINTELWHRIFIDRTETAPSSYLK